MRRVNAGYCYRRRGLVCMLVTAVDPAKTAEPTGMRLGVSRFARAPKPCVIVGVQIVTTGIGTLARHERDMPRTCRVMASVRRTSPVARRRGDAGCRYQVCSNCSYVCRRGASRRRMHRVDVAYCSACRTFRGVSVCVGHTTSFAKTDE